MKLNLKKMNTDRVVGISAMIVSLLTFIIFVYQTNIINKQSRLSVQPRLTFHNAQIRGDTTVTISSTLINKGLGPAIVRSAKMIDKDSTYSLSPSSFFTKAYPKLRTWGNFNRTHGISEGRTLAQNESIVIFEYVLPHRNIDSAMQYLNMDYNFDYPMNMIVEYASMYEEVWRIESDDNLKPVRIK